VNDLLSNNLVLIALASFVISAIVLYSGFGLSTLLLPVFALFFPLPAAIAAAAVVHLVSNLFKFYLFKRNIDWPTVFKFGVPAMFAAIIGSLLLGTISADETLLARIIGGLIIFFALFELLPVLKKIVIPPKWLSLGGLISGFFGGLSGHQGAIRSAFLLKTQTSKDTYIATGVAIAILVDINRLVIYGTSTIAFSNSNISTALVVAVGSSLLGILVGNKFYKKISFNFIQTLVGALLLLIGVLVFTGVI
jgi:uncharacterized membrane protein YfcA